jgi:hypothetical protein
MITIFGILIIPVGLVLFFKGRNALLWATVGFAPFFELTVWELGPRVQPMMFFGGLLILRIMLERGLSGNWTFVVSPGSRALLVFLVVAATSLIMPLLIQRGMHVLSMSTSFKDQDQVTVLRFSLGSLKYFAYPVAMSCLFFALVGELNTVERLRRVLVISVALSLLVVAFGVAVQLGLMKFGNGFVRMLFYPLNGMTPGDLVSVIGRIREYSALGPLPRMFSLTGEPGFTGPYFLTILGLTATLSISGRHLSTLTFRSSLLLLGILSLAVVLTGSTKAYVGVFTFMAAILVIPRLGPGRVFERSPARLVTYGVGVMVALLITASVVAPLVLNVSFIDYLTATHLAKLQGGAGAPVRLQSAEYSLEVFMQSPILGVGYGSHRTGALLTSMLTNVGLIGTVAFLGFNWVLFSRALFVYRKSADGTLAAIALAMMISLATVLPILLAAASILTLLFGWYWIVLATMEATYRVHRAQTAARALG